MTGRSRRDGESRPGTPRAGAGGGCGGLRQTTAGTTSISPVSLVPSCTRIMVTERFTTSPCGLGSATWGDGAPALRLEIMTARADLDLYVANLRGSRPETTFRNSAVRCLASTAEFQFPAGPRGLAGSRDRLYHNNGRWHFQGRYRADEHRRGLHLWPGRDLGGLRWRWMAGHLRGQRFFTGSVYHNNEGKSFTEVG